MGIKVANLAKAIAGVINYPEATAAVIARFGRDEGLLTTGARGRHVPDATALDCARLLIAMLGTQSPAKANGVIRDFGRLVLCEARCDFGTEFPDLAKSIFSSNNRLEDGLAALIEALGRRDFAAALLPEFTRIVGYRIPCGDETVEILPEIEIWINISMLEASISFNDATAFYEFDVEGLKSDVDKLEAYDDVRDPYSGPVKLTASVDEKVVCAVAEAFHGHSLIDLWDTANAV